MAERTCIVTREVCDPARLIRFVAAPDGSVVPDLKRKLPGRGVWVTASRDHVENAVEKSLFARGLKTNARAGAELPGIVETLLTEAALGALGFARKAGQCVAGSGKVDDAIRAEKAIGALHATDGAEDGLRKIRQAATAASGGDKGIPVWRVFSTDEMSLALGAAHVIHAALIEGGAARKCARSIAALAAYRGSGDTNDPELL
ncbi:MAG: RNA-binding protein [Rhizobiaceae bacterium]